MPASDAPAPDLLRSINLHYAIKHANEAVGWIANVQFCVACTSLDATEDIARARASLRQALVTLGLFENELAGAKAGA